MSQVFISYSHQDVKDMQRLKKNLTVAGIDVWVDDTGLEPGTSAWQDTIASAIKNADCLVVVLTPNAKKSEWVNREIEYADNFDIKIFPALISGDENKVLPISLIRSQRIDLRRNYKSEMKQLIDAISKHLGLEERPEYANLIKTKNGKYEPAQGYEWVNDNPDDLQVVWSLGSRYSRRPHVYAGKKEGQWILEPGYSWVNQIPGDMKVRWSPGVEHSEYPNVVAAEKEGTWEPAEGYEWINEYPDNLQVGWTPQKSHSTYSHVIAGKKLDSFEPASGYEWVTKNMEDFRVKKVLRVKSKALKVKK